MPTKKSKVAILGSGSWGTALASVVAENAQSVSIWGIDEKEIKSISTHHENTVYLPGIKLQKNISATLDLKSCLESADLLMICVPTKAIALVLDRAREFLPATIPIVSCSKGICTQTGLFPSQMVEKSLGASARQRFLVLSGPSFAKETILRRPTAVTLASPSTDLAESVSRFFTTSFFKTYLSKDIVGVEVGGALKNVIAIAAGISDGLQLGPNTLAGLITRGLAEITRYGIFCGAEPLTFLGLSGVGDLVLTCTGGQSRNRTLGGLIAEGHSVDEALKKMYQVAEGYYTAQSIHKIIEEHHLDMPITSAIYDVLFQSKSPLIALSELMARPLRAE